MDYKMNTKTLSLGLIYFFLVGFVVLFLVDLLLRSLIWPFFENTLIISIINLFFNLLAMYLAIKFFSPIFKSKLEGSDAKHFLIVSSFLMFLAVTMTGLYLYSDLTNTAKMVQFINSGLLLGFFSFFSYNYIVKDKI